MTEQTEPTIYLCRSHEEWLAVLVKFHRQNYIWNDLDSLLCDNSTSAYKPGRIDTLHILPEEKIIKYGNIEYVNRDEFDQFAGIPRIEASVLLMQESKLKNPRLPII